MLPRRHRLTRAQEFTAVVRGAGPAGPSTRRSGTPLLVVHLRRTDPAGATPVRVGFVVSRAVGNAVVRHRVARRLRALVASRLGAVPVGSDLVVRATPRAAEASWVELGAALDRALGRVTR